MLTFSVERKLNYISIDLFQELIEYSYRGPRFILCFRTPEFRREIPKKLQNLRKIAKKLTNTHLEFLNFQTEMNKARKKTEK